VTHQTTDRFQPYGQDPPTLEAKSTSAASGSSRPPTSTWRSSSPPRGRRPAIGRSRCGATLRKP